MKKLISFLLAYCLLVMQFGCITTRSWSHEKALSMEQWNQSLVLHTKTRNYKLSNYMFTEDFLQGNLMKYSRPKEKTVHVYTNLDLNGYTESGQLIFLERLNIERIIFKNHSKVHPVIIASIITVAIVMFVTDDSQGGGFLEQ